MNPDEYCAEKVAPPGSALYYSVLFLPPEKRAAITALYAFREELLGVLAKSADPGVAHTKLNWWRDEIERTFAGSARHPVTQALMRSALPCGLEVEKFKEVVRGVAADLQRHRYADAGELEDYCGRVSGNVGALGAMICGHREGETLAAARDLGIGVHLTDIVTRSREDAARKRLYHPEDALAEFGVSPDDLQANEATRNVQALLSSRTTRARTYLERAVEQLPSADRQRQFSGVILARIYLKIARAITRSGSRMLSNPRGVTPLGKLWIAWTTQRKLS